MVVGAGLVAALHSCNSGDGASAGPTATSSTGGSGGMGATADGGASSAGRGGTAGSGVGGDFDDPCRGDCPCGGGGCILWLRGDLGVTQLGGQISAWADQSGDMHDATQPAPNNQPALVPGGFAGHDAVDFVRAESDWMEIVALSGRGANYTVLAVLDQRSEAAPIQLLLSSLGPADWAVALVTPAAQVGGFNSNVWLELGAALPGPQYLSWLWWGAGNSLTVYRGETPIDSVQYIYPVKFGATTALGKYHSGLQHHLDALVAEVIVYDYPLTTAELAPVWQYIQDRYGL